MGRCCRSCCGEHVSAPDGRNWVGSGRAELAKLKRASRCFFSGQLRPRRTTMGHSQYDPALQARPAWNVGKTVGTKRPLTQKQIWAVRFFLDREGGKPRPGRGVLFFVYNHIRSEA